jgi:hypothetical protein
MKLLVLSLSLAVGAMPPGASAQEVIVAPAAPERTNQLAFAFSGGSGGSPLGHTGLELRFAHRRVEAFVGAGLYIGDTCRDEGHPPIDQCLHPVAAFGLRYAVFRRGGFSLAPGLGLSLQPDSHSETLTRPAYGPITWQWHWGLFSPRLNADLEARYRLFQGEWFFGVAAGAGAMVASKNECVVLNMTNFWSCSGVPSPAYAAPTPVAITAYGNLLIGRTF